MNREDAIITLTNTASLLRDGTGYMKPEHEKQFREAYEMAIKALTAQPEQRWIPCSEETGEGFPKEDGRYYVTEQNYGFYLDPDYKKKVAHMSIFKDGDFTDRYYDENHSNITAWCKLPEPYGGEKE